jgi:hypothetical protein
MAYLRRTVAEMVDGFYRGVNVLLYGWPCPRYYPAAVRSDPGSSR